MLFCHIGISRYQVQGKNGAIDNRDSVHMQCEGLFGFGQNHRGTCFKKGGRFHRISIDLLGVTDLNDLGADAVALAQA